MKRITLLMMIGLAGALLLSACSNSDAEKDTSTSSPAPAPAPIVNTEPEPTKAEVPKMDRGAMLYKRCATCHTLDEGGRNKVGPNLYGIFGAKAGNNETFNYSKVMTASEIVWTDENLAAYIQNPKTFMPGNRMAFIGIRKSEDVELVLEYMRQEMTR